MKKEIFQYRVTSSKNGLRASRLSVKGCEAGDLISFTKKDEYPFYDSLVIDESTDANIKRVKPFCVHYYECGGCSLQHISYIDQVKIKEKKLFDILPFSCQRKEKLLSPSIKHFRNKIDLSFGQDVKGKKYLGMNQPNGKCLVFNLIDCQIADDRFVKVIDVTRKWWSSGLGLNLEPCSPRRSGGFLKHLTIRSFDNNIMVVLGVSGGDHDKEIIDLSDRIVESMGKCCSFAVLRYYAEKGRQTIVDSHLISGNEFFTMKIEGGESKTELLSLVFHYQSFSQTNSLLLPVFAKKALNDAFELLGKPKEMWDAYCGVGLFGITALSMGVGQVFGFDCCDKNIMSARKNAEDNQLSTRAEFVRADANDAMLMALNKKRAIPELITLDPPRVGLGKKGRDIVKSLGAKGILYVSCNPRTQYEDLSAIKEAGYEVLSLRMIDMFPNSEHVESVAVLRKV